MDPTYCIMSLCEWEAVEERISPLTGETLHLCAQCCEAYDMGFTHGQTPTDQIVPPKEEDDNGTNQGSEG